MNVEVLVSAEGIESAHQRRLKDFQSTDGAESIRKAAVILTN